MPEGVEILQAELKALETKLENKKRELAESGAEQHERTVFKEVLREHGGIESASQLPTGSGLTPRPGTVAAPTTLSSDEERVVEQLIEHAFTKGIPAAIKEAKKYNAPFLIDALHDRLVDEYYQKLLDSRKVNPD